MKSPGTRIRDQGQNPTSLPHLLYIQQASCFTYLSLSNGDWYWPQELL